MDIPPPTLTPQSLQGLRALVSVTRKEKLAELKRMTDAGLEVVSSGGTATALRTTHGVPCTDVSAVTKFPEMLDGRLKTLHPLIVGGLLGDTANAAHRTTMGEHGILPFHLVIIDFYDFESDPQIEKIDIGGPGNLRAAAKNGLIVIVDIADYERVFDQMLANGGMISEELRDELVLKVFEATAAYDTAILKWMKRQRRAKHRLFETALASKQNRVSVKQAEPPPVSHVC